MKRTVLVFVLVGALFAMPVSAKDKGDVPKPENLVMLEPTDTDVTFDWDDVEGAEKYSLDIEGVVEVTVPGAEGSTVVELEFDVSFGTSDYNEDMSESQITIPLEDLHAAIDAAIAEAIADAEIEEVDDTEVTALSAKVKGLDPHNKEGKRNQDNPFSDPIDLLPHPEL